MTKHLNDLFALLSIPSISTLAEHKGDIRRVVDWISNYLNGIGISDIKELYGKGMSAKTHHPVLFAQKITNPKLPTVLIYGHYDVQPVDPIDQWYSDPFKPEIRGGFIYARGATDDKGQFFTHLAALSDLGLEWGSNWPINVKILLEGEEEMGGENIAAIFADPANTDLLASDLAVISDTEFLAEGQPVIEYGLRGIAYMQINVKLATRDLHSGVFGGGVLNPANALTQILARLQDIRTGKILIPKFYDDVVDIDAVEKDRLAKLPFNEKKFLAEAGSSKASWGETGYSIKERTTARPTLDINGIWGGFSGEGSKTIIPATAHAKVSMRLVANQQPEKIAKLFSDYVKEIAPKEVDVAVEFLHGGDGTLLNTDSHYFLCAMQALEKSFKAKPLLSRSGGSIPVAAAIKKLGIDPIMIGYGLPGDNLHSPNERFSVLQFEQGIECNKILYRSLN